MNAWLRRGLGSLLTLGALNALGGGVYGLSGAEGVPKEWLAGSPFRDYLVPSLILLVVVGGSLLIAAIAVWTRKPWAEWAALVAAGVLLGWIAVQLAIIGLVSWLQPAVLGLGVSMVAMASFALASHSGRYGVVSRHSAACASVKSVIGSVARSRMRSPLSATTESSAAPKSMSPSSVRR